MTLTWETNHPERKAWTQILTNLIAPVISIFTGAQDITTIRPDFGLLTTEQQVSVIAQFLCSDAYYESSWDPTCNSTDVGTEDDKDTWSVGLWQMSMCDSVNTFGFQFADLQQVKPNAQMAINQMVNQIKKTGLILLDWDTDRDDVYWSTLAYNNRDNQIDAILADVQAMSFDLLT